MSVAELVAPAHRWVPDHVSTAGPEVCDLADQIGIPLDPEQAMALDAMYAEKPGGKLAALEAAVVAPRRNIKTHIFKAAAWADLLIFDQPLVVWTAHEFSTALEAFLDMKALVDANPMISRRVKKIIDTNGKEGIEFHKTPATPDGQRLRFRARTKSGGRGLGAPRVFLDEAFALKPAHLGALLPIMAEYSQAGDPQIRYGSSAGLMDSGPLRAIRDRGRAGGDPGLVYLEWCAPELPCEIPGCDHHFGIEGCTLDRRDLWAMANLALGRRIDIEFVAKMRRSMPPEEFAREFLGWWDDPADAKVGIDLEAWAARADRKANLTTDVTLALDVSPGQVSGAIVACGGAVHVVEHASTTAWMPSRLASLLADKSVRAVGLDATGPASALIPDLTKPVADGGAGLMIRSPSNPHGKLVLIAGRDATASCELLLADVLEGRFVHRDQGSLNVAVATAFRRAVGDSWKWSRRDSTVDISPLVAATHAWFLWSTLDADYDVLDSVL